MLDDELKEGEPAISFLFKGIERANYTQRGNYYQLPLPATDDEEIKNKHRQLRRKILYNDYGSSNLFNIIAQTKHDIYSVFKHFVIYEHYIDYWDDKGDEAILNFKIPLNEKLDKKLSMILSDRNLKLNQIFFKGLFKNKRLSSEQINIEIKEDIDILCEDWADVPKSIVSDYFVDLIQFLHGKIEPINVLKLDNDLILGTIVFREPQ